MTPTAPKQPAATRRPDRRPTLVDHGQLREVTRAVGNNELSDGGGMGSMKPGP